MSGKEWTLAIENINSENISCNIDFTTIEKTYLNNYIISLSGTTQGNGQVVEENGYRYEGKNPNNYIWFNNELWRIIGVFDSESHGQNGENLVKIIRANSIGGLAWNKSNSNNWSTSSLMNLLNGAYLNSKDGTGGEYCYGYSTTVSNNCDYRVTGINEVYRLMIREVTWYLGSYQTGEITVSESYTNERGTVVNSGKPTSWEGYIGLMNPSDFGYSILASNCARSTNLSAYSTSSCGGQSWLYGQSDEWTITPSTAYSWHVFRINSGGGISGNSASVGLNIRPVLYMESSVYIYLMVMVLF